MRNFDPQEAYRHRISRNDNLSLRTMHILQQVMNDNNAYTSIYYQLILARLILKKETEM